MWLIQLKTFTYKPSPPLLCCSPGLCLQSHLVHRLCPSSLPICFISTILTFAVTQTMPSSTFIPNPSPPSRPPPSVTTYSKSNYCKSLLLDIPQKSIHNVQLVQNAITRNITKTPSINQITPVPIKHHNGYKIHLNAFISLIVLPGRLSTMGSRAFSLFAPRLWKSLPPDIRNRDSLC